jgi:hypothetical protein
MKKMRTRVVAALVTRRSGKPFRITNRLHAIIALALTTSLTPSLTLEGVSATEAESMPIAFSQITDGTGTNMRAATPVSLEGMTLTEEQVHWRSGAVIGAGAVGVALYGWRAWWEDGLTAEFGTEDEGWFGEDTYAGGADKLGHAFSAYIGTRLFARGLEWAGNPPDRALRLGALSSFAILLGVEIGDGLEKEHQFSWEDLVMNTAGVGLGVLLEKRPSLDELVDFRLQYWLADARRRADEPREGDYDGHTYLLVAKASGVPALRTHPWLRYLELAVGYGTMGFDTIDDVPISGTRLLYYGISLNLSEVLHSTVFRGASKKGRVQRITKTALEFFQVPGTALLADERL